MTDARVDDDGLMAMELHFHALIRHVLASTGGVALPDSLPRLDRDRCGSELQWFPVPGMYGGFSWTMQWEPEAPSLIVESWSRVVEGSGKRHRITPNGWVLESEGFV